MLRVLMFIVVIGALAYGGWVVVNGLMTSTSIDKRHAVTGGEYTDTPKMDPGSIPEGTGLDDGDVPQSDSDGAGISG